MTLSEIKKELDRIVEIINENIDSFNDYEFDLNSYNYFVNLKSIYLVNFCINPHWMHLTGVNSQDGKSIIREVLITEYQQWLATLTVK